MYKCSQCGANNQIVNQCGCDPHNMPTPVACWAVWAEVMGDTAEMNAHAMVWCVDNETAKWIAAFESEMVGIPHDAYLGTPPREMQEAATGVFVKRDPSDRRAISRVQMALAAKEHA